ncbi:hypothetical protein MYX82_08240 [Acidobacteria bacterium AH-259-D05]|nr:hypothetical protein [Acidobacteria bacterium AH-259-D05]
MGLGFLLLWSVFVQNVPPSVHSEPCLAVLTARKLPVKLKTRGPVQRARWEQVDEVLAGLDRDVQQLNCEFRFDELFRTDRKELYIPVTNNLVRMVPEVTLKGVSIFNQSEEHLGEYESRVSYSRTGGLLRADSYTLYHFQFRNAEGEFQTSGHDLLLDHYLVRWSEIAGGVAIKTSTE